MSTPTSLILDARVRAGLSQRQLAEAAGTSQPAVARLESGSASPTFATLERLIAAAGFMLRVDLVPLPVSDPVVDAYKRDVDRTLLRANLTRTVEARLVLGAESTASGDALRHATRIAVGRRRSRK